MTVSGVSVGAPTGRRVCTRGPDCSQQLQRLSLRTILLRQLVHSVRGFKKVGSKRAPPVGYDLWFCLTDAAQPLDPAHHIQAVMDLGSMLCAGTCTCTLP